MILRVLMLVSGEYFEKGPHLFSKIFDGEGAERIIQEVRSKGRVRNLEVQNKYFVSPSLIDGGFFQIGKERVLLLELQMPRLDHLNESFAEMGWQRVKDMA